MNCNSTRQSRSAYAHGALRERKSSNRSRTYALSSPGILLVRLATQPRPAFAARAHDAFNGVCVVVLPSLELVDQTWREYEASLPTVVSGVMRRRVVASDSNVDPQCTTDTEAAS